MRHRPHSGAGNPAVLEGHDLLAGAQTGTGKTAAFTLPMLHRLSQGTAPRANFGGKGIRALVLTPTRELAAQVEESVRDYGKYLDINSTVVFWRCGHEPTDRPHQAQGGCTGCHARAFARPAAARGFLDLSTVEILVLDEADRMLDMGFIHDVKGAGFGAQRQAARFSATFSDEIRELANTLLKNPKASRSRPATPRCSASQVIHPWAVARKTKVLLHIIQQHNWSQVLVFTRTKFGANNVAEFLTKNGVSAMALHGNKSQSARTQALAGFKSGEIAPW